MDRMRMHQKSRRPEQDDSACLAWALLLPDAAEGLLSDPEQRALGQHLAGCPACTQELAEAQRGLAWLTVLKERPPEPPSTLLNNILAQTTGVAEAASPNPVEVPALLAPPSVFVPANVPASGAWAQTGQRLRSWLGMGEGSWSALVQPRLAMTGAMAFFSICLTLNLTGFSVDRLDPQTFRKGSLHRTVADTGASVVRSIESLRMVYRVESRVNEMRALNDSPADADSVR